MGFWGIPQRQEGDVLSSIPDAESRDARVSRDAPGRGRRMSQELALLSGCRKAASSLTPGRALAEETSRPRLVARCPPFPAHGDSSPTCSQACSEADWTRKTGWVSTSRSNSSSEEFSVTL